MHRSVLIVNHDADRLFGIGFTLEAAGFDALMAVETETAITLAQETPPAALVVELGLAEHDGVALSERIQAASGESPACVLTANASDATRAQACARRLGAVAVLEQPIADRELVTTLQRSLPEG